MKNMTKKAVVVSGTKSEMEMTVAVSESSLFMAVKKPLSGVYRTISRKKLPHYGGGGDGDGDGGRGTDRWVDSMRASSPTHCKSRISSLDADHLNLWMVFFFFFFVTMTSVCVCVKPFFFVKYVIFGLI